MADGERGGVNSGMGMPRTKGFTDRMAKKRYRNNYTPSAARALREGARNTEEVPWGFRGGRGSILTACRKVEQKRRRSMGFMAFDILEGRRPLVACVRRTWQAGLESCHAAAEQSDGSGPPPAACGGEGHFAQRSRLCR